MIRDDASMNTVDTYGNTGPLGWSLCTVLTVPALDELDRRLLAVLTARPRLGVLELSRLLGVARGTAQARLDRLQAAGVVTGFGPQLDLSRAGLEELAFVTLEIAQGGLAEVRAGLDAVPEVLEAYGTTGAGDVLCRVAARDRDHLQDVLLRINRCAGVVRSNSVVALSEVVGHRVLPALDTAGDRPGTS
jgi:DNA-binding Lrp family transcriptional regulator